MMRFMLLFLLVNTYGRSLGKSVGETSNNKQVLIGNLFKDLTKRCINQFVSSQITSKINECNISAQFHNEQLRCLIFYDASSLICDLPDATIPNLAADFTNKTNEKQNLSVFCSEAARFNVPMTSNHKIITKIFQGDVPCKNICADDDVFNGGTNLECKYFKWVLEILQTVHNSTHGNDKPVDVSAKLKVAGAPSGAGLVTGVVTGEEKLNETNAINTNKPSETIKDPEREVNKTRLQNDESNPLNSDAVNPDPSIRQVTGIQTRPANQSKPSQEPMQSEDKGDKIGEEETNLNNPDSEGEHEVEQGPADNNTGIKPPVIESPDNNSLGMDDEESEDPEMGGENARGGDMDPVEEDSEDNIGSDIDEKLKNDKSPAKLPETKVPQDGSHGEIVAGGFSEDDDHFFPLFLSGVVLVVVLYVLYHNKNKVAKMFFGLIVEGRQTGRRRNSRGHAYRRLDTLEQAMSANTPAPPSKIIY